MFPEGQAHHQPSGPPLMTYKALRERLLHGQSTTTWRTVRSISTASACCLAAVRERACPVKRSWRPSPAFLADEAGARHRRDPSQPASRMWSLSTTQIRSGRTRDRGSPGEPQLTNIRRPLALTPTCPLSRWWPGRLKDRDGRKAERALLSGSCLSAFGIYVAEADVLLTRLKFAI